MKNLVTGLALLLMHLACYADVTVNDAWARATPSGAAMGAAYMELTNPTSQPVHIVRLETSVAKMSEVHESMEHNGMMRMKHIDPLVIASGETVILKPGGKHVMLMKLIKPLVDGEKFLLTLIDENAETVPVEVIVGSIGQMEMPRAP